MPRSTVRFRIHGELGELVRAGSTALPEPIITDGDDDPFLPAETADSLSLAMLG
jgi:hypothetical protein